MMPEDKFQEMMGRAAQMLDKAPSMADEVMHRIDQAQSGKHETRSTYRFTWRERIFLMSRNRKAAAALLAAVVLAATGWAAEKAVRNSIEGKPVKSRYKVDSMPTTVMSTDGSSVVVMGGGLVMVQTESTGPKEFSHEQLDELDKLISRKEYKLISTSQMPAGTLYRYSFVFSDGVTKEKRFLLPLEGFKSLADYNQKYKEYESKRREAMQKALTAGRYRLVDIKTLLVHMCVDVATGKKISVEKVTLLDGSEIAIASEVKERTHFPSTSEWSEWEETHYETTWQEHLDSIMAGRRKLLDAEVINSFWYEMTLEDGSKTIYSYGGGPPLEKMRPASQPAATTTGGTIKSPSHSGG